MVISQPAGVVDRPSSMDRPHVLKNVKELIQLRKKKLQNREISRDEKIGDGAVVGPLETGKLVANETIDIENAVADELIREIMDKEQIESMQGERHEEKPEEQAKQCPPNRG